MSWSFRIARIAGIDVKIHWTFFILLLWFASSYAAGSGVAGAIYGVAFLLSVFACVLAHEFGHALTARRFGIQTSDVTLLPIGGVARLEKMPDEPPQEMWVALAGPAVNVVIAGLLAVIIVANGGFAYVVPETLGRPTFGALLVSLMWANIALVVFNLLPAFPMDGGRVLRALLAWRGDRLRATETAARVGQGLAIIFGVLGVFSNPILIFVALFVYLGAEAEAKSEKMSSILGDLTVADAMQTRFRELEPLDTLAQARNELLSGSQQEFPIRTANGSWCILHREDLLAGLRELGAFVAVTEVARKVPEALTQDTPLSEAVRMMNQADIAAMPVQRGGSLVGLLTRENLGEMVMVREAMRMRPSVRPADRNSRSAQHADLHRQAN